MMETAKVQHCTQPANGPFMEQPKAMTTPIAGGERYQAIRNLSGSLMPHATIPFKNTSTYSFIRSTMRSPISRAPAPGPEQCIRQNEVPEPSKGSKPQMKEGGPRGPLSSHAAMGYAYFFTSKRSSPITFAQAFTKSFTNFSLLSCWAYTSAMARSCELLPKTRSTRVPVHFSSPLLRSRPS